MKFHKLNEDVSNYPETCKGPFFGVHLVSTNSKDTRVAQIGSPDKEHKFKDLGVTILTPKAGSAVGGRNFLFLTELDAQRFIDDYLNNPQFEIYKFSKYIGAQKIRVNNDFCYYKIDNEITNAPENPFIVQDDETISKEEKKKRTLQRNEQKVIDTLPKFLDKTGLKLISFDPKAPEIKIGIKEEVCPDIISSQDISARCGWKKATLKQNVLQVAIYVNYANTDPYKNYMKVRSSVNLLPRMQAYKYEKQNNVLSSFTEYSSQIKFSFELSSSDEQLNKINSEYVTGCIKSLPDSDAFAKCSERLKNFNEEQSRQYITWGNC